MKYRILKSHKLVSISICMIISLFLITGCGKQGQKLSVSDTAMGTVVQETLYVTNLEQGQLSAGEILAEIEQLEQECLSWRLEGAELAGINATAGKENGESVSQELRVDLEKIWQVSDKSNGALDVTIGQVTRLWDLDTWAVVDDREQAEFQEPEAEVLQAALKNTGYEKVVLKEDKIYLPEGMSLDLGAVGKGIACDRIGAYLATQEHIEGAVISVGGSIVTYGSKPDDTKWKVAILHPREDDTYLGTLSLQGEWYISTSGDYERYVEKDGVRYHHIMNPGTGYPANSGVCSVTILSDSGLLSDALSTACYVLGVEEGMKLAEAFGVEALFVTQELEIFMTAGMKEYFVEDDWR